MIPQAQQPTPLKGTRVRIYGPEVVNGMRIWRVFDVTTDSWNQIGPPCFSYNEAIVRAREATTGKAVIWFGGVKLQPTPYY